MLSRFTAAACFCSVSILGAASNPDPTMRTFTVPLTGAAQSNFAHPSGGTGDMDGTGVARLTIDPEGKQLCYDFRLSGLSTPLLANIHHGKMLHNGPPVVTLFTGPGGELDGCVYWLRSQLTEIVSDPQDFYVEIGTTEYPDGALRGQLAS